MALSLSSCMTTCSNYWTTRETSFLLTARSEFEPKYRFERCQKVRGTCKTFCDDDEYDYGHCIKWRNQCCI
ncbi:beta-defensin 110-like [Lemur catta]|uniref:beta-defensin 110-like n=1 Tax=Lemur catta TaxID=9447 RepID=UPI001E2673DF|nr:beta-defensin 110-like [Lemur catta]